MSKIKQYSDSSSIEWVDRETLKYSEGSRSVLIWVDFEPGVFSRGRIIKTSSITSWSDKTNDDNESIDDDKKQDILNKVKDYYEEQKIKYRIEE